MRSPFLAEPSHSPRLARGGTVHHLGDPRARSRRRVGAAASSRAKNPCAMISALGCGGTGLRETLDHEQRDMVAAGDLPVEDKSRTAAAPAESRYFPLPSSRGRAPRACVSRGLDPAARQVPAGHVGMLDQENPPVPRSIAMPRTPSVSPREKRQYRCISRRIIRTMYPWSHADDARRVQMRHQIVRPAHYSLNRLTAESRHRRHHVRPRASVRSRISAPCPRPVSASWRASAPSAS